MSQNAQLAASPRFFRAPTHQPKRSSPLRDGSASTTPKTELIAGASTRPPSDTQGKLDLVDMGNASSSRNRSGSRSRPHSRSRSSSRRSRSEARRRSQAEAHHVSQLPPRHHPMVARRQVTLPPPVTNPNLSSQPLLSLGATFRNYVRMFFKCCLAPEPDIVEYSNRQVLQDTKVDVKVLQVDRPNSEDKDLCVMIEYSSNIGGTELLQSVEIKAAYKRVNHLKRAAKVEVLEETNKKNIKRALSRQCLMKT